MCGLMISGTAYRIHFSGQTKWVSPEILLNILITFGVSSCNDFRGFFYARAFFNSFTIYQNSVFRQQTTYMYECVDKKLCTFSRYRQCKDSVDITSHRYYKHTSRFSFNSGFNFIIYMIVSLGEPVRSE